MNPTDRDINYEARKARFRLELMLIQNDHHNRTAARSTIYNQTRQLANAYNLPPWFVRGLVEGRNET